MGRTISLMGNILDFDREVGNMTDPSKMTDGWAIFYKDGEELSGGHKTLSAAVLFLAKMQITKTILVGDRSLLSKVVIDNVEHGKRSHLDLTEINYFGLV